MTPRRRLATSGERGKLVRLIHVTGDRAAYVVQWGPAGAREQRSWPATKAGKAEAEAFFKAFDAERVAVAPVVLTTRALWLAYQTEEFPTLRPNSQRLYAEAWKHWEAFYGPETRVDALLVSQCADFRRALEARGFAISTTRYTIRVVRGVYNWAERTERLAVNRWHRFRFKVTKGTQPAPRAEYRFDEFVKIWRELDPTKAGQWRAWCLIGLLGIYGNRQHAILALEWEWVCEDEIVIPASVEKNGKEATLPLFPLTRQILAVARQWATTEGYDGPMIFYPGQKPGRTHQSQRSHYSIQSLTDALHLAERRAGVPYIPGRAGHGFRRGLVGDLADATGDIAFALQAIGDSLAMAPRYRVRRNDRLRDALSERIGRLNATPEGATDSATIPDSPTTPRS